MQLYYRGYYDLSEERYLEIISRKTGSLIAMCCYLGAQAAGAKEDVCQSLEQFGMNIGIAFQIMDDITDLVGEQAKAGKSLRRDMAMEKMTLPGIQYFSNCSKEQGLWAREVLRQKRVNDYNEYVHRLEESGSVAYARSRAKDCVEKAKGVLSEALEEDAREILGELADSVVE